MYLEQPRHGTLLDQLGRQLSRDGFTRYSTIKVLVAYAKMSGVERVSDHFAKVIENGGTVDLIIGIGQRNTSKEAVERLLELGCTVSIFHNPSSISRTFHPKVYLLEGATAAWASVGSNNLTAGGLKSNYEISQLSEYNLTIKADSDEASKLKNILNGYSSDNCGSSRLATDALIAELHDRGLLPSEAELWEATRKAARASKATPLSDLFEPEKFPEPPSKKAEYKPSSSSKAKSAAPAAPKKSAHPPKAAKVAAAGFWKRLSSWDVSHSSSPGQIQIPKACWHYFPSLSAPLITPSGAEQADSYFDVVFQDSSGAKSLISNARRILYTPAPDHPRPNPESRFTFRQGPGVFDLLKKNDVLEFRRSSEPGVWFEIHHVPSTAAGKLHPKGKFGSI